MHNEERTKQKLINKFLSRTWIACVYGMSIQTILVGIFFYVLIFTEKDTSWFVPSSMFCQGIVGLFVGLEKLIDNTRVKNNGNDGKNNQDFVG